MLDSFYLKNFFCPQVREIYDLKSITENNNWHNTSVFDHTVEVLEKVEELIPHHKSLDQKINDRTRAQLLILATILHDLGKKETLIINEENKTNCPDHEEISAAMSGRILDRFNLSRQEKESTLDMIRNHGIIHDIIKSDDFRNIRIYPFGPPLELLLLGLADTQASILSKTKPENYQMRTQRYEILLKNYGKYKI